ncbi:MAG: hypothetical protein M3O01_12755 [Pseudomonadota bacterium]|nr:hypothetical protein [Pseudomonadota bacterium]
MQFDRTPRPTPLPVGQSRLTFRRLRRPTPVPSMSRGLAWSSYLARLSWLFG